MLGQRRQIQALDFRGHGESGRAANYQVMDYVEDAIQIITSSPGDVYLYGHSLGAMVAAAAAAQAPNRVRGLILEDPPFETMGSRIADSPLLAFFSAMRPFASCGATTAEIARQFGDQLVPQTPGGGQARVRDLRDQVYLRFTASALHGLDPGVLDAIVSGNWLARYHWEQILRTISCPTLLLQADAAMGGMLTTADVQFAQQWMADLTVMTLPCGQFGSSLGAIRHHRAIEHRFF